MELGVFLVLVIVGAVGLVRQSITFLALSIAVFFVLAVYFTTGVDIVKTTEFAERDETIVRNELQRNSTGTLLANTTITETKTIPAYSEQELWINQNQDALAWIFFGLGSFAGLMFFYNIIRWVRWI